MYQNKQRNKVIFGVAVYDLDSDVLFGVAGLTSCNPRISPLSSQKMTNSFRKCRSTNKSVRLPHWMCVICAMHTPCANHINIHRAFVTSTQACTTRVCVCLYKCVCLCKSVYKCVCMCVWLKIPRVEGRGGVVDGVVRMGGRNARRERQKKVILLISKSHAAWQIRQAFKPFAVTGKCGFDGDGTCVGWKSSVRESRDLRVRHDHCWETSTKCFLDFFINVILIKTVNLSSYLDTFYLMIYLDKRIQLFMRAYLHISINKYYIPNRRSYPNNSYGPFLRNLL